MIKAFFVAAICVALGGATAQAEPIQYPPVVAQIAKVESDFDAYTHDHGQTKGFFTFSAPDAIGFHPQAERIHERLGAKLAQDNSEADAPSKLRWRAWKVVVSPGEDMAYDMGPWTIDGTDKAGWFLTIWKKQPDGSWKWVLDTGAGTDTVANVPAPFVGDFGAGGVLFPPNPNATSDFLARNGALDAALTDKAPKDAYKHLLSEFDGRVAGDAGPPSMQPKAIAAHFALRPVHATWTMDGYGSSANFDMVYAYGHATTSDGTFAGHYVRIWRRSADVWEIAVDLYQSAK
jgi:ketosteroid isomerase-like protein